MSKTQYISDEVSLCGECVNYKSGTCAWRLNSPDYPTATVGFHSRACENYGVPSTRILKSPEPVFDNLPVQVEAVSSKSHDHRRVVDMQVISVPALHRLGRVEQHFPVVAVTVAHRGETAVFFLENTKNTSVHTKRGRRKIATNRYDVAAMFNRVADKGTIKLSNWERIQVDI